MATHPVPAGTTVVPIQETRTVPAATAYPPHGHEVRQRALPIRAVVFVALAVICGALDIAGVATSFLVVDAGSATSDTTLWRTCTKFTFGGAAQQSCANVDDTTDGCTLDSVKAMRAFGIMSILVAFLVCVPLGVADIIGVLPLDRSPTTGRDVARDIMAAGAVVLMCFELVFWAILAGLWNQGCGGRTAFKDVGGSRYGPAGPLFIVAWILSLAMIVVPLALSRMETKTVTTTHPVVGETRIANEPVIR